MDDPGKLQLGINNLKKWEKRNPDIADNLYHQQWIVLTQMGVKACVKVLLDTSEKYQALNSSNPFAGVVDYKTREKFFREWVYEEK